MSQLHGLGVDAAGNPFARTEPVSCARVIVATPDCACRLSLSAKCWSERRDSNPGPPVPQTGALTGLRYAPPIPARERIRRQAFFRKGAGLEGAIQAACSRDPAGTGAATAGR